VDPNSGRRMGMARVMIAEDEPAIAMVLCEVLKDAGHDVLTATGGAEAIESMSRETPPDVLLLDLFMPHVGGREVIEYMRSTPELKEVPVVLVTGAVPSVSEFPPEGSYQALLSKPFDLCDVLKTVETCVGGPPADAPAAGNHAPGAPPHPGVASLAVREKRRLAQPAPPSQLCRRGADHHG